MNCKEYVILKKLALKNKDGGGENKKPLPEKGVAFICLFEKI